MATKRDNITRIGKRFSAEYQPENKGRKKSRIEMFISEWKTDIDGRLFARSEYFKLLEFLLSCNQKELEMIEKSEDLPISILTVIRAIKEDFLDCNTRTIEMLIDRIHGRTIQPITGEIVTSNVHHSFNVVVDKDAAAIITSAGKCSILSEEAPE